MPVIDDRLANFVDLVLAGVGGKQDQRLVAAIACKALRLGRGGAIARGVRGEFLAKFFDQEDPSFRRQHGLDQKAAANFVIGAKAMRDGIERRSGERRHRVGDQRQAGIAPSILADGAGKSR